MGQKGLALIIAIFEMQKDLSEWKNGRIKLMIVSIILHQLLTFLMGQTNTALEETWSASCYQLEASIKQVKENKFYWIALIKEF